MVEFDRTEPENAAFLIAHHLMMATALWEASDVPMELCIQAFEKQLGESGNLHLAPAQAWLLELTRQYAAVEAEMENKN